MMVFTIGQHVLPAFSGMKILSSPRLMFASQLLLFLGCPLRVGSEVIAYQEILAAAWNWLPYSAMLELSVVTLFAVNLIATSLNDPPVLAGRVRNHLEILIIAGCVTHRPATVTATLGADG